MRRLSTCPTAQGNTRLTPHKEGAQELVDDRSRLANVSLTPKGLTMGHTPGLLYDHHTRTHIHTYLDMRVRAKGHKRLDLRLFCPLILVECLSGMYTISVFLQELIGRCFHLPPHLSSQRSPHLSPYRSPSLSPCRGGGGDEIKKDRFC